MRRLDRRSKANIGGLAECLKAGISVVSVNIGLFPRREGWRQAARRCAAARCRASAAIRAEQGGRVEHRQAADWRIRRFCRSLLEPVLAFQDDMADPKSDDPSLANRPG